MCNYIEASKLIYNNIGEHRMSNSLRWRGGVRIPAPARRTACCGAPHAEQGGSAYPTAIGGPRVERVCMPESIPDVQPCLPYPSTRCYLDGLLVQADRHSWLATATQLVLFASQWCRVIASKS